MSANGGAEDSMSKLKEREQRILNFMRSEILAKGYPPTVREICTAMDIKSTSTAHKSIAILVKEGYLEKDPSKPRALKLVNLNLPDAVTGNTKSDKSGAGIGRDETRAGNAGNAGTGNRAAENAAGLSGSFEDDRHNTIEIPIVGRVAAGIPITAEENIDGSFPVPAEYVRGNCFMLRVSGDSMINAGIMDGDLILVEQQQTANNGDIVVAMVDGFESEATVKTFYKESGHIRLQPENDSMSPIILNDVSIQGKVKGVFRYFS